MARSTRRINTRVQIIVIVENHILHFLSQLTFNFCFTQEIIISVDDSLRTLNSLEFWTLDTFNIRRFFSSSLFLFAHYSVVHRVFPFLEISMVFCTGISPQFIRKRRITLRPQQMPAKQFQKCFSARSLRLTCIHHVYLQTCHVAKHMRSLRFGVF